MSRWSAALGVAVAVSVTASCGGHIDDPAAFAIDAAIDAPPPVQPPRLVVSPPPGTFAAPPSVTLTIDDPQGLLAGPLDLWYTLDGSRPVVGSSMRGQLGTPIVLDRSRGLRVFAADSHGAIRFTYFGAYLVLDETVATFSSNIPVIVLWGEPVPPEVKLDTFTESSLSVFLPGAGGRTSWPGPSDADLRAGIKIHGSSTANYPKHPWHVETRGSLDDDDQPLPLLGMASESDWILNAPLDFDRALMRNSLAFTLSNAIDRWAPHTEWAEVFIAGGGETVGMDDYVGVYEVTEMIKRGPDRVAVAHLESHDVAPPAVSGGYIFKEDRLGPGETGWPTPRGAGGVLRFTNNYVLVDPAEADAMPEQKAWIRSYLDDVAMAVTSPTFTDPMGVPYDQLLDVDAFIDHHIINMFTKNPDAFRLSGYYYKDRGGLLVEGPVWDFDRTMGCSSDGRAQDPTGWGDTGGIGFFDYGLYGGLFKDPAFAARYFDRLGQLLKGPLSPQATRAWIDDWAARLAEPAARNFARWSSYAPRVSYGNEVKILRDWVAARALWLDDCIQLDDPLTCH
ncbi:MAG TPA: CotH kinase family protein [Kofleriaceae bacterium]|nr:CotH kinase family protein [Kofleriaceae bacterium]